MNNFLKLTLIWSAVAIAAGIILSRMNEMSILLFILIPVAYLFSGLVLMITGQKEKGFPLMLASAIVALVGFFYCSYSL